MRIQFTENVDVDLKDVPKPAFGALGVRHARPKPQFGPEVGVEMKAVEPVSKHYFRKGRCAELPTEQAQEYIGQGVAVLSKVEVIRGPVPGYEDSTQ